MKVKLLCVCLVSAMAVSVFAGMLNTIGCPDCGNPVSTRAFMCPKCGCSREAIQQQAKAVEELSKLPESEQRKLSNDALFGQLGRVMWLKEERIVRNVMTNETVAIAKYTPQQKKAAQEASATIKRILEIGFTMDQIFIMRHDLISAALGKPGRTPLAY